MLAIAVQESVHGICVAPFRCSLSVIALLTTKHHVPTRPQHCYSPAEVQLRGRFALTGDRTAGVSVLTPPPPCVLCCSAGVMKSGVLRAADRLSLGP